MYCPCFILCRVKYILHQQRMVILLCNS